MIRKIQRRWFEVWGEAEAQNSILKYMLLVTAVVCIVQLVLIGVLCFRKPLIVSVTDFRSEVIDQIPMKKKDILKEIVRAIRKYLERRNNWDWSKIEDSLREAGSYVAPDFRERYLMRTAEQVKIAKERQVSQRLFTGAPVLDEKAQKAVVRAERVLVVSGIRAAQEMTFLVSYVFGARTTENPEGVYVTSDEVQSK